MTELVGAGGLTSGMRQHYSKMLLSRTVPLLVHMQYGKKDGVPVNEGKSIQWRRYERPAATTTALTEGTPGAVTRVTISNVQATLDQYGQYNLFSDLVDLQNFDPYIAQETEVFGESMGISLDTVVRNVITGGTTVQYASVATTRGGASGVGSGMTLNFAEIREAVATLEGNDAPTFPDAGGKYIGIIHPDTKYDLFADSDILSIYQNAGVRGGENPLFKGMVDDIYRVRFIETTQARVQSSLGLSNVDVYQTLIFGQEFYGVIDYDAMRAQVIVKQVGSGGSRDPLNQEGSIGWKAAIAAAILDQNRGVRIEHAASLSQALK